ncbi:MAG: laccase domain-containing protein [Phycisphaerales bacterium]|nr:laccase domain-containing protein [Phycisphaerales bacterium]
MIERCVDDTRLFQFGALNEIPGFHHVVTSKPWNMATHCGPDVSRTLERRRRVCDWAGLPFERLVAADQIHSPHVIRVTCDDAGRGRDGRHTALRFVDGLVCAEHNLPVMQFSADCPLVLLVEPERRVFGTAHASWRGTVAGITTELVRQLECEFDVDPAKLIAAICPCAGPWEYQVGEEVLRIATARLGADAERFFPSVAGLMHFDMRGANLDQLVRAGVCEARIHIAAESTIADDRFYSYRREGADTGRFALVAGFVA